VLFLLSFFFSFVFDLAIYTSNTKLQSSLDTCYGLEVNVSTKLVSHQTTAGNKYHSSKVGQCPSLTDNCCPTLPEPFRQTRTLHFRYDSHHNTLSLKAVYHVQLLNDTQIFIAHLGQCLQTFVCNKTNKVLNDISRLQNFYTLIKTTPTTRKQTYLWES